MSFKEEIEKRILEELDECIKVLKPDSVLEMLFDFHKTLEEAKE